MRRSEFLENCGLGFKGLWEGFKVSRGRLTTKRRRPGDLLRDFTAWACDGVAIAWIRVLIRVDSILTAALLSSSSPFTEREREKERAIFQKTMEAPTLKMLGFSGLYSGWVEWAELIRVYMDYKLGWARLFLGKYPKKTIVLPLHIKPWLSCIFG